jgi:two-component sensor histidine kinase
MSIQSSSPVISKISRGLAGEADHRIANSLTLIRGLVRLRAARANAADDPRTFLMEIADRIETVAKLHRLVVHSNFESVQLAKYLREICERLSSALAPGATLFSVACSPDLIVPFKVAMPLGLITAELFSNSLKYAHPAGLPVKIVLSCSPGEADGLTLVYEDDGVGFPEEFDYSREDHMGLRFIRLLGEQLQGTPKWLSDPLGIRFELDFRCCFGPARNL